MTAAFVPTFSRTLERDGREAAWTLGRRAITALLLVTVVIAVARHRLRRADDARVRRRLRAVPGKFELTVRLTRLMFPFLPLVAVAVAAMGMLNALGRFFVPALAPAMFNVASIACIVLLVPVMPGFGVAPVTALAHGGAGWRARAGAAAVAAVAPRGLPLPVRFRAARSGAARDPAADGAGHARRRRDAVQRVREHGAGDQPAGRRRVVAQLRVPHHVPADRPVRRRHRQRVAAADVAAGRARGHAGPAADALARRAPGAGADGAGHVRPDRARACRSCG